MGHDIWFEYALLALFRKVWALLVPSATWITVGQLCMAGTGVACRMVTALQCLAVLNNQRLPLHSVSLTWYVVAACKLSCWQMLVLPGIVRGLCLGTCRCKTPFDEQCIGCATLACSCCHCLLNCKLCCLPDSVEQRRLHLLKVLPSLAGTCLCHLILRHQL